MVVCLMMKMSRPIPLSPFAHTLVLTLAFAVPLAVIHLVSKPSSCIELWAHFSPFSVPITEYQMLDTYFGSCFWMPRPPGVTYICSETNKAASSHDQKWKDKWTCVKETTREGQSCCIVTNEVLEDKAEHPLTTMKVNPALGDRH